MAPAFAAVDWYDVPLYYDMVFDESTRREGEFLERVVDLHGRGKRHLRILEPACGSGRLVEEMARRGHRVTGFDANENALAFARARLGRGGLRARLLQASLVGFELKGPFELAHCMVSTFKYLLSEDEARSHLLRVARALVPGGLYVLGFHLSRYGDTRRTRERWVVRRDGVDLVCNIQTWPADRSTRLEKVRTRIVVRENGEERRLETRWSFRTYSAREFRALLRSVGAFELVANYDFNYDAQDPRRFSDDQLDCVVVLRRKA